MKVTNGNHRKSPEKNRKSTEKLYHKVVVWNKQSSYLASDHKGFPVIQRAILKHNPNLVVLTEANLSSENLANVANEFNGYVIHHKVIPGTSHARVAVMVKKSSLNLKRLKDLEHPDLACMWFKLKFKDQTIIMAAWY